MNNVQQIFRAGQWLAVELQSGSQDPEVSAVPLSVSVGKINLASVVKFTAHYEVIVLLKVLRSFNWSVKFIGFKPKFLSGNNEQPKHSTHKKNVYM